MTGDDDLLERATRALREAEPPTQDELAAARVRLLHAQRVQGARARARTLRWVLPLAAVLAAGSALAATPQGFERLANAITSALDGVFASHPAKYPRPAKPKQSQPAALAKTPEAAEPGDGSTAAAKPRAPAPVEEPVPAAKAQPPLHQPKRTHRRPETTITAPKQSQSEPPPVAMSASASEAEPASEADADLTLYKRAHSLHFRTRDFRAALPAWDAYLDAFPSGTFAVEARYNRAICLIRLNRTLEARAALLPFARGEVAHGYRRAEADKLLKALE